MIFAALFGWLRHPGKKRERIVPEGEPQRGAESVVILLLLGAAACAVLFIVVYADDAIGHKTQFLGLALGGALACISAALVVTGKSLVVTEEIEEDYPEPEHPDEQDELVQLVEESGSRLTRKRLLQGAAGAAGAAVGAALITPALSLGPALDLEAFSDSPWRRGRRLVDRDGRVYRAADIEPETFYTAYPEGKDREQLGAPLVVVRLDPSALKLPRGREGWAPQGIVAYSKVCTHAGCAVSLYRKPTFAPTQPRPALVCPCHYSTFDPARGAEVIFGPAGRPLPQLPLMIDRAGRLRAAGNFSGPVGPSWWLVRKRRPRSV
jgi:ubiquinol-cytochrome c reductase iron-sulfur subunit